MPVLTITAVDNTQDLLTIVGHGLVTGAGPVSVRLLGDYGAGLPGDALGALPAPLVPATDYWLIRVSADTFKLATSSANALANVPINLTTNGTGTHYLEYGIPYRRARTYAAGSQVKSVDLDAIQDAIIALNDRRREVKTRVFGPLGGAPVSPLPPANLSWNIGTGATSNYVMSSGAAAFVIYLPFDVGDRILGIAARVYGDGAADATFTAGYLADDSAIQSLGNVTDTNRSAAWADLLITPLTTRTLLDRDLIAVHCSINAANYRISRWVATFDRP